MAPDTAAHAFVADDSGISCGHVMPESGKPCGLPWPHERHRVRVYHPFQSGPASWLICADDGIMVGDRMAHERWHQEMSTVVGNGGTLTEPSAASQSDNAAQS